MTRAHRNGREDGVGVQTLTALILGTTMLTSPFATAQDPCELDKLIAPDGTLEDHFGVSVSIADDVAIVGAFEDDDQGIDSGSAYVYRYNGATWVQEQKLLASEGAAGDLFGFAVGIDGEVAIVGAHGEDAAGQDSGAAYIFRHNGQTWVQEQRLTASDGAPLDEFSRSVAISGDVAIVGAQKDDVDTLDDGSAYVFRYDGSTWIEEQKLTASDAAPRDHFGNAVSITGDVVLVGAESDDDNGFGSGSAYVFRHNGPAWVEEQKLTASDGAEFATFGRSASIDGDVAIIGAQNDGLNDTGAAYVYRYDPLSMPPWIEQQKLGALDAGAYDFFGCSVSITGDVAIVGASFKNDLGINSGSAYVFRWDAGQWMQTGKLLASDGAAYAYFGCSVSIGETMMIVGAFNGDGNGIETGSAYVFATAFCPCPADLDGSDTVDVLDLQTLLGAWGDCADCDADFDDDGVVGVLDLLALLGAWGPCE